MVEKEEKIEEIVESSDEESGLEEDVEKAETNIDKNKFQDVMVNINSKSPSLEDVAKIQEQKPLTSLEMGASEGQRSKEDKDEIYNAINYDDKKEKSYAEKQEQRSENMIVTSSGEIAKQNLRETIQTDQRQDFQINPELQGMKSSMQDDYSVKAPTGDFKEAKTQDPFQKSTKEYEFR